MNLNTRKQQNQTRALVATLALLAATLTTTAQAAKPPPQPATPTHYFIRLGTFGGTVASASALNQLGQVAGGAGRDSTTSDGQTHAFLVVPEDTNGDGKPDCWFRDDDGNTFNDLMLDLGLGAGFELGSSYAQDVNDAGQVIVNCHEINSSLPVAFVLTPADVDGDGRPEWFLPDANGANALLTRLEFGTASAVTSCEAKAINRSGQIVGGYLNGRGFLMNALDTDQDGVADTWYQDANGDAVNDLVVDLGEAMGLRGSLAPVRPARINAAGQVAGAVAMDSGTSAPGVPFIIIPITDATGGRVWNTDANHDGINDLVIALPVLAKGMQGAALGVNSAGAVVGWAATAAGVPHAMLWQVGDSGKLTTTDLGLLKGEAECQANAVNDSLQVVGFGRTYYMRKMYITESAFLWQNGVMKNLRDLVDQGALLEDRRVGAYGVNNQGLLVGTAWDDVSGYPFVAVPIQ